VLLKLHSFSAGKPRERQTDLGSVTSRSRELLSGEQLGPAQQWNTYNSLALTREIVSSLSHQAC